MIEGRGGGKEEVPGEHLLFEGRDLRVAHLLPLPFRWLTAQSYLTACLSEGLWAQLRRVCF